MSKKNPYRSKKGCLTCKKRKKKCDETRPQCKRCTDGSFDCLGYSYSGTPGESTSREGIKDLTSRDTLDRATLLLDNVCTSNSVVNSESWMGNMSPWAGRGCVGTQQLTGVQIYGRSRPCIPKHVQVDPLEIDNMIQFIVTQVIRLSNRTAFRPFPFSIQNALAQHLKSSSNVRWSMYIGSRITQALFDGTSWHPYVVWIDDFCSRLMSIPTNSETRVEELVLRLNSLQGMSGPVFSTLGSVAGYTLHRRCLPQFLQLAARFPEIWTSDSAISISHMFHSCGSTALQFIITDTMAALAFAIPPLICYDTTVRPEDWSSPHHTSLLDRIHGWPVSIPILCARINSFSIMRRLDRIPLGENDRSEFEESLKEWRPVVDYNEESSSRVAWLKIQECWRNTLLIYMYMAGCGVDSADPQVETLIQQVYQLANTVEEGDPLEAHLLIPCLIASVAARKERHRKTFHRKITGCKTFSPLLLRVSDFVPVLDHLWHGAASGGCAVTWDAYMDSRSVALPIDN